MTLESAAELIRAGADIFESNDQFSLSDKVIKSAFEQFPGNEVLSTVLPKVILINAFYSTQIYSTEKIARHILTIYCDSRLDRGDLSLIDSIRHGHGIIKKSSGREIDFYSFATKYAALHKPDRFPIFDSLVARLLPRLNKELCFYPGLRQVNLRDYSVFVSVVDALSDAAELADMKYKRLDQGLWILAKRQFDRSNLTEADISILDSLYT